MINRQLSTLVLEALHGFPVVYVNGPRQSGKSTLVQSLAASHWPAEYLTFDEATTLGAAAANPESFLRAWQNPVILDEVQLVPALFRPLKMLVDERRLKDKATANGRYLLTGSANIMALPRLADALVGRMHVLTLYPLSAVEIAGGQGNFLQRLMANDFTPTTLKGQDNLVEIIRQATFPEISGDNDQRRRQWFESYITTILQRDVRHIADIAKLGVLPNLLKVLATRAGGLINDADIARAIGQNAVTTKNYRILLQMMFLTFDVAPWFRSIGKRLVKAPKGYVVDTSLLCHLQQTDLAKTEAADPQTFGHIFENFVATELLKQLAAADTGLQLHHFRTSDGKEVDFVLESADGKLAGIEVKGRDAVTGDDFKHLKELEKQTGEDFVAGIVLYKGARVIPFGERLWAVPVGVMWE